MKFALVAASFAALVLPAAAQDATPLLRVYIDSPYFYDILVAGSDATDPAAHSVDLVVEGKEVGASNIIYDCSTGEYSEEIITTWTGASWDFLPAAMLSYRNLYC